MRAKSVSHEEQYRLIMECRSSGLSDYQWRVEHGIKPGTFYSWVKRLRSQGSTELSQAVRRSSYKCNSQDVVKIQMPDIIAADVVDAPQAAAQAFHSTGYSLELCLSGCTIHIRNDADPLLLEHALRIVRKLPC